MDELLPSMIWAVLGGVMLVVVLGAFVGIGGWIVLPIDRAAKARKAPVRFSIGDFLCLFLAIQIPLAAVHVLIRGDEQSMYWTFTAATWVVGPLAWFTCAQSLSKAGVSHGKHRIIFLGLVLPIVYYGLIPFVLLPAMGARALVFEGESPARHVDLVLLWIGLGVLLALCGLYTRWLVRQAESPLPITENAGSGSI